MTEPEPKRSYILPIRRPVSTVMLFVTMVVFGWKSYQQLSLDLMPNISYPTLTVRTEFEGAAPADVEELLTRPLEETLSTVGGMVEISSVSSPGLSEVILEYTWDTDMNTAQQDVRDRLDLFMPPDGVGEKPVILRYDPTLDPVMRVAVTGLAPATDPTRSAEELTVIRDIADRQIKSDLEGELGIAQVLVKGGREEEIQVRLDAPRLKNLGITPAAVVSALAQQNINLAGGRLKEGKTEYLVRTVNEFQTIDEIRDTIIPNPAPQQIRVRDVAEVLTAEKDRDTLVRINGVEAVELAIFKWGDANTVEVCNKLKDLLGFDRKRTVLERVIGSYREAMASTRFGKKSGDLEYEEELAKTIQSRLPDFARMTLISDQSAFIVAAIDEVKGTAIMGGLLALLILFFFLRELRTTIIIGVAIPISIVATFVPMFLMDISLNIMSLGGIALGVGMLVDDSIIVLESIFRCQEEGDSLIDAVDRGTREVFAADTASTFTTIAVFLPIAFVDGVAGQLFRDLALTVTFSLLASLAVALYLNPMMMAHTRLDLGESRGGIWMMRAWRAGRAAGKGRAGAILGIFPAFFRYTFEWLRIHSSVTLAPLSATARTAFSDAPGPVQRLARRTLAPLLIPQALALALLFALQILLKSFAIALTTVLASVMMLIAGLLWVVSKVVMTILWLPLAVFEKVFNICRDAYTASLRAALPFGPVFLVITLVLAVHAAYVALDLGRELIPPLKQGEFGIRMEAPPGTRLEQTVAQASPIEAAALGMPEIETVAMAVGSDSTASDRERGENTAQFTVRLRNPKENAARQDEIIATLRDRVQGLTTNPVAFTLPTLFSFKTAVELQVRGDNLTELRRIGTAARDAIADIPGLKDAELSMKRGYPEVILRMDPVQLADRGLTADQVAQRLRTEVQGDVSTRFSRGGEKVDIRVLTDRTSLNSLDDLRALSITEGDRPIPLASVADISVEDGPSEIRRIDQRQVAVITANVEGRDLGAVAQDIEARIRNIPRPRDYQFVLGGQNRELASSYKSLQFALMLAIFLVYVVMACQFESLHHPALVMFSVPLAFIGVVYGLVLLDIPLSIMVFIGGIVLAGIVVNDAIILVDYINQLRARGLPKREAVIQAGRVRMRPILMTTLTTILGLVPMAFQGAEGAEIRRPMAITIIAGEISSTLLILFIIPMIYDLLGGRDRT